MADQPVQLNNAAVQQQPVQQVNQAVKPVQQQPQVQMQPQPQPQAAVLSQQQAANQQVMIPQPHQPPVQPVIFLLFLNYLNIYEIHTYVHA